MSEIIVSVMMPAYNAEQTIAKSLMSLVNQTYSDWECIVVDDGSKDNTVKIVESFKDARIKLIKLEKNMGRGYARQVALERSSGQYIAMLDADDWYYSTKLESQMKVFEKYPEISLVSCAMAVTDIEGNIVGVRSIGDNKVHCFDKVGKVPFPHAPSIYRKKVSENIKYDPKFLMAQDVDFLRRMMMNKKYCLLSDIKYVYEEQASNTVEKIFKAYYFTALGYLKFYKDYPLHSGVNFTLEMIKIVRLYIYNKLGLFDKVISDRSSAPDEEQKNDFLKEKTSLDTTQGGSYE